MSSLFWELIFYKILLIRAVNTSVFMGTIELSGSALTLQTIALSAS